LVNFIDNRVPEIENELSQHLDQEFGGCFLAKCDYIIGVQNQAQS